MEKLECDSCGGKCTLRGEMTICYGCQRKFVKVHKMLIDAIDILDTMRTENHNYVYPRLEKESK